jgi:hypothetical protein
VNLGVWTFMKRPLAYEEVEKIARKIVDDRLGLGGGDALDGVRSRRRPVEGLDRETGHLGGRQRLPAGCPLPWHQIF